MPHSLSGSPARKRQRLSSPTYDELVEDLTEEHLAAFDAIEERLSQQVNASVRNSQIASAEQGALKPTGNMDWGSSQPQEPSSSYPGFGFASAKATDLRDDPDNPFTHGFSSAAKLSTPAFQTPAKIGFASASKLIVGQEDYERSPSPEVPPPEPDLDAWFNPTPVDIPPVAFTTPMFSSVSAMAGFSTASAKGMIMPSKEALAKAKARIAAWQQEEDTGLHLPTDENSFTSADNAAQKPDTFVGFKAAGSGFVQSPKRSALQAFGNTVNTPGTPTPGGFSRPLGEPSKATASPGLHRPGQFKPPSFKLPHTPSNGPTFSSPLNPNRPTPSLGFTSAASQHPLAAPPITGFREATQRPPPSSLSFATPLRSTGPSFTTPLRSNGPTGVIKTTPAPFKTPFKPGMGPGQQPGRSILQSPNARTPLRIPVTTPVPTPAKVNDNWVTRPKPPWIPQRKEFFNLNPSFERKTLIASGLKPQQHDADDLEYMGINASMLNQINPETALYYSFHTTDSTPPPSTSSAPSTVLGPAEALRELLDRGCTLATKPWVDNHWCLILWKLAGMVGLDPEKEVNPDETRWCWTEVMRQLLYRYERELNSGSRPPLRKIANQDAPAAFPLVLCVSNVFWSEGGVTEDGLRIEPHPELEVTDGWYRLRAQVDLPMARAVRKGAIRVGRKIGVAGARLSTEKKDPTEILEAYNSTKLVLSGNSSHLMPWHAKLGFMRGPCISTLHSLTPDGGVVAAMDFVITKAYPVAFLEFIEDPSLPQGQKRREGPRNEAEENKVNEQWKRRCEMEASKLRAGFDKKYSRYDAYIDRLERKAGSKFHPGEEDCPPDNIDALYDELEYPDSAANVVARISPAEAGWLALHIRKQSEAAHERIGEEIEKELKTICPPRDVRSFRMLVIQDARTLRRPANRTAQLTVWDVLGLTLDEGSRAGGFEVGQRFMATNLAPVQYSAWMGCEPGDEVFLSTRRDTRWTRIKGTALSL